MPRLPAAEQLRAAVEGALRSPDAIDEAVAFAREEPILLAIAIAGALGVVIGLGLFVKWLRRPFGERFCRLLAAPESVTVLMHPNPDPDAMAAALGVAQLAERAGTPATIQYAGQIRHQENRAFQTVLDLSFEPIDSVEDITGEAVVVVDHNVPRGFEGAGGIVPYAVVDHHPGNGTGSAFTDVRTDYGACATIVAEYFEEIGADPAAGGDEPTLTSTIATGLLYGILADTNHLTCGCSGADFAASAFLYPGVDEDALDRIANPQVDAEVLDIKARSLADRDVRGPFAVSDVGSMSNADAVPQAADELLQLEGVTSVVVFGDRNGTIHLSGRSRDDRVHMGKTLQRAVETIPMADAGGHARMGGGQLSTEYMAGLGPSTGMTREEFVQRLFDCMAGDV